ncbi:MAG TPA: YfiR family protein [Tepidisphaeraceae bacterium]|jgi:hypothetical protein
MPRRATTRCGDAVARRGRAVRALAWLLVAAWLAGGAPLCGPALADQAPPSREYQLKAAYLCNFLQFIAWPPQAFATSDSPIVITVQGENPFGTAIEQCARGKNVRGRPIVVRYAPQAAAVGLTHVLFVAGPGAQPPQEGVGGGHVLSVADAEHFTAAGGCVRFFAEQNKIRFEINTSAAHRAGLKIQAKLLQLARIHKED